MPDLDQLAIALSLNKYRQHSSYLKKMCGGHTNSVWLLNDKTKIVLKKYSKSDEKSMFPNSLVDEVKVLKKLEKIDIAPKLLKSWPKLSIIAYRYVEGRHCLKNFQAVVELIKRKERLDAKEFKKVSTDPKEILLEGDRFLKICKMIPNVDKPTSIEVYPLKKTSLIHRDISTNLIEEPDGQVKIIDWQCPANGDICEDIFSILSPGFQILANRAPLSKEENSLFWNYMNRPDIHKRYNEIKASYAWRHGAFCFWRSTMVDDRKLSAKYKAAASEEFNYIQELST